MAKRHQAMPAPPPQAQAVLPMSMFRTAADDAEDELYTGSNDLVRAKAVVTACADGLAKSSRRQEVSDRNWEGDTYMKSSELRGMTLKRPRKRSRFGNAPTPTVAVECLGGGQPPQGPAFIPCAAVPQDPALTTVAEAAAAAAAAERGAADADDSADDGEDDARIRGRRGRGAGGAGGRMAAARRGDDVNPDCVSEEEGDPEDGWPARPADPPDVHTGPIRRRDKDRIPTKRTWVRNYATRSYDLVDRPRVLQKGVFYAYRPIPTAQRLVLNTLYEAMDEQFLRQEVVPRLNRVHRVSLRTLNWMHVGFAREHHVAYRHFVPSLGFETIVVMYDQYRSCLSTWRRRGYDPFRRRHRLYFDMDGETYSTTVAQLHFFHVARQYGFLTYAALQLDRITDHMKRTLNATNAAKASARSRGEPYRRKSLVTTVEPKAYASRGAIRVCLHEDDDEDEDVADEDVANDADDRNQDDADEDENEDKDENDREHDPDDKDQDRERDPDDKDQDHGHDRTPGEGSAVSCHLTGPDAEDGDSAQA